MIFVFGSSGFIGKHLTKYFYDNNINFIEISRNNIDDFKYQINENDVFINLIGYAHGKINNTHVYNNFYNSNILSLKKIIDIIGDKKINKLIHMSSLRVYVNSYLDEIIVDEKFHALPDTLYGQTKICSDYELIKWSKLKKQKIIILRPPLVYGKNVKGNLKKLVTFCKYFPIIPFKNNLSKRSILSVTNLCSAILHLVKLKNEDIKKEIYLIRDKENIILQNLVKDICNSLEKKRFFISAPSKMIISVLRIFRLHNIINQIFKNVIIDKNEITETGWYPNKIYEDNDFKDIL